MTASHLQKQGIEPISLRNRVPFVVRIKIHVDQTSHMRAGNQISRCQVTIHHSLNSISIRQVREKKLRKKKEEVGQKMQLLLAMHSYPPYKSQPDVLSLVKED